MTINWNGPAPVLTILSKEQQDALEKVRGWLQSINPTVFCLYGHAGTGKTSLALEIAKLVGHVSFVAYTGKAALALRAKGCSAASTIHRLIYRAMPLPDGAVRFVLREPEELKTNLIIVDECSMVDEALAADLLSFGRPILAMGDPFQLPPIEGRSFFDRIHDVYLRDVHRQATTSPIIRASERLRRGIPLEFCDEDGLRVISSWDITAEMFIRAEQIIVGRNETRKRLNRVMRQLRGCMSPYPEVGDRLVCLKSNYKRGLINGGIWAALSVASDDEDEYVGLTLQSLDDEERRPKQVRVLKDFFDRDLDVIDKAKLQRSDEFDYAYALTAHKAQGSQWPSVLVIDENAVCDSPTRWTYTAITRASDEAVVVQLRERVRRHYARAKNWPILPGGEDPAVEKAIVSAFLSNALGPRLPTVFEIWGKATLILQELEDEHVEAKERVRGGLLAMLDRGALKFPGAHSAGAMNGQHLSPAWRQMVAERWKPVVPSIASAMFSGANAGRPRGRPRRSRQK